MGSFPFQLFKYGYTMIVNGAELKTQCQYYLKRLSLQLWQSQPDVTHPNKELVHFYYCFMVLLYLVKVKIHIFSFLLPMALNAL